MTIATLALSLKQPWAALVVHGLKSIEVRRWSTGRRGRIFIHAAKIADPRPEAWRHLPPALKDCASLSGGIIGSVELTGCIAYCTARSFRTDCRLHLNEPDWFTRPRMYGFVFTNPATESFRPMLGNVKFFSVTGS